MDAVLILPNTLLVYKDIRSIVAKAEIVYEPTNEVYSEIDNSNV
jgi:hypothetical protein